MTQAEPEAAGLRAGDVTRHPRADRCDRMPLLVDPVIQDGQELA
jgi:hypothetical protein